MAEPVRIRLFGTGGFMPTEARETACALVRRGPDALLIDAGSGTRRLVVEPGLLEGAERLHVVLTHFHLDHTIGLMYLTDLELPLEIWGGGEVLERTPTPDLVARLSAPPFLTTAAAERLQTVHELAPPETQIGGFRVACRVQPHHPNPTLALRIDDALAWCTDTALDQENAEFVRGVRVLFHESFHAGPTTSDTGHTASGEIAALARDAAVERLVLIHVNPLLDDDHALLHDATPVFAATEVGRDGLVVDA